MVEVESRRCRGERSTVLGGVVGLGSAEVHAWWSDHDLWGVIRVGELQSGRHNGGVCEGIVSY